MFFDCHLYFFSVSILVLLTSTPYLDNQNSPRLGLVTHPIPSLTKDHQNGVMALHLFYQGLKMCLQRKGTHAIKFQLGL